MDAGCADFDQDRAFFVSRAEASFVPEPLGATASMTTSRTMRGFGLWRLGRRWVGVVSGWVDIVKGRRDG